MEGISACSEELCWCNRGGLGNGCGLLVSRLKSRSGKGGAPEMGPTLELLNSSSYRSAALSQQAFVQTWIPGNKKLKINIKLRLASKEIQLSVLESTQAFTRVLVPQNKTPLIFAFWGGQSLK